MKYRHMQINKIGIAALIIITVVSALSALGVNYDKYAPEWLDTSTWNMWAVVIVIIAYLFAINMMVMQIKVSKTEVLWSFGLGFPRKKLLISDISTIERVTNKWWYGWGIRKVITGGWLYNVYGLQAVEITTDEGKQIRLGTDEPKKLYKVLETQLILEKGGADDG